TDAAVGDARVRRDIRCLVPSDQPLNGAYLLEATATLEPKRVVGNRSIICTSDFILTQKRTPTSIALRVSRMADYQPVAGLTVRAVAKDNVELSRAVTDANGIATFVRGALFPAKKPGAHLFVAETKQGPALQFVEGQQY